MLYGVIGDPIKHSKSPLIHNFWIKEENRAVIYCPFHVKEHDLVEFLRAAPAVGVRGLNVTIPHKERVHAVVAETSERAQSAQSINTLIWDDAIGWRGDSTDGDGFLASLAQSGWRPEGMRVAMIGAGGAARAVVAALMRRGAVEIRIANRSGARVEALEADFPIVRRAAWPVNAAFFEGADLVVNASSLGMVGGPPFDIAVPPLAPGVVATDMIYAPLETPFLAAAAKAGARTVDGFGMLLEQARESYALWFGAPPPEDSRVRSLALSQSGFLP